MKSYKTIIIDDEHIARKRLRRLLKEFNGTFEIIAEAKNGQEGLELITTMHPDLIFLDIQMPGKTGFEMLNELSELPLVVFCTAHEEYALQAFNTMALDYLVKPVEKERLQLTVDKLKTAGGSIDQPQIEALLELVKKHSEPKKLHSIPHKVGDRVILVKPEKISYFSSNEKYVDFYSIDGEKYVTDFSLNKLEELLPTNFRRVRRGLIVNINHIKEFRKYFRGKYILVLNDKNNTKLETGRSYADELKGLTNIE